MIGMVTLRQRIRQMDKEIMTLKPFSEEWFRKTARYNLLRMSLEEKEGAIALFKFDETLASRQKQLIQLHMKRPRRRR